MLSYFCKSDFNSIKVRLKQFFSFIQGVYPYIFQFHKGTIKTCLPWWLVSSWLDFNSIKVRLKQFYFDATVIVDDYFNSIKVRLKLPGSSGGGASLGFQFHKGTIKTFVPGAPQCCQVISIP